MLAFYCDPFARRFWSLVYLEDLNSNWNSTPKADKVKKIIKSVLHQPDVPCDDKKGNEEEDEEEDSGFRGSDDEEDPDTSGPVDEYSAIDKEFFANKDTEPKNLESFLKTYNPLTFWTKAKQQSFPSFFQMNAFTLSFGNTSIIQESVFSSAGDTLTQRRKRLLEDPEHLEAVVILRYYLGSEKTEIRLRDKAFIFKF